MPRTESPAIDPKANLVPLCSVPYDPKWPQRLRLNWIVDSAKWLRSECPRLLWIRAQYQAEYGANQLVNELRSAIQQVTALWTAALQELPPAVTRPLNALRDGFTAHLSDDRIRALLADLVVIEDEARRLVDAPDEEPAAKVEATPAQGGDGKTATGGANPDPIAVAVTMKARNPALSVRDAAKAVGIKNHSVLQKNPLWKAAASRVKAQAAGGSIRRGSKGKDGTVEAVDE